MPIPSPGLLAQISGGIQGRFQRGLDLASVWYNRVAEVVPSTKKFEIYPFIGDTPALEKWIGTRQAKQLTAYNFTIDNDHYEGTLKINKDQVEDNDLAGFYPMAERLGRAAGKHPDALMATLIEAGFATACYDGEYFFDTDHPGPSGNQSNKGTTALSATSYATARAAMGNYVNDAGKKLGIVPDLLVVPPALETVGRQILNADYISVTGGSTESNVWKGSADLLVVPELADANNWYLFATKQLMPALIYQARKDPVITPRVAMTDDNVFWMNEFVWGVDMRGAAGYGAWQCAFGAAV